MSFRRWLRPPHSLLALFLGTTLVLLTGLGWLGLRSLDQERAMENQRVREQLESAADLIAEEIRQNLADIEEQLIRLSVLVPENVDISASNLTASLGEDALIVVFGPDSVQAYPSERLTYYPVLPLPEEPPAGMFATGELYEFRTRDFQQAIAFFDQLAGTSDAPVRAGALLRLARNQRKAGRPDAALATYDDLAAQGSVPVGGQPAELVARRARCDLLEALGRHDELRAEARTLERMLQSGRWRLTRTAYRHFSGEVQDWLRGVDGVGTAPTGLALAAAVDVLWERWRQDPRAETMLAGRETLVASGAVVSVFWSGTGDRLIGLVSGPGFIRRRVIGPSQVLLEGQQVAVFLSDPEGEAVASSAIAGPAEGNQYVLRTSSDTRLPWALRVASTDPEADPTRLRGRRRLLLAGLGFAVLLLVAGGYFSARAIARESEAARLQSDFVAAVSHEFRTPLTSMRQFTDLLADGRVRTEAERNEYYAALSRGTERLTRLVENLLDFGRLEAGSHGFNMEAVGAREWIERVTAEFQGEVARLGYEIRFVWDAPPQTVIRSDEAALGRALWNLLDNAVKYSPDSKTIWVEVRSEAGWLTVSVRDRGVGIPAGEQRKIFRKFVRGSHPAGQAVRGTGLGLALVEQIVRAHGGAMRLESQVGQGSTFSIHLPIQV